MKRPRIMRATSGKGDQSSKSRSLLFGLLALTLLCLTKPVTGSIASAIIGLIQNDIYVTNLVKEILLLDCFLCDTATNATTVNVTSGG